MPPPAIDLLDPLPLVTIFPAQPVALLGFAKSGLRFRDIPLVPTVWATANKAWKYIFKAGRK